jgi:phosphoribosylformylglycinamidine cyclo-ligase
MVHITGGGFNDNMPRIIPGPCRAIINKNSWEVPQIFNFISEKGDIDENEMFRVFNMGIGMMVVVPEKELAEALERLRNLGEQAYPIGVIEKRDDGQAQLAFV